MCDCKYCLNTRVILNAYGIEDNCPACKGIFFRTVNESVAREIARKAAEMFVRDLGDKRKAVS